MYKKITLILVKNPSKKTKVYAIMNANASNGILCNKLDSGGFNALKRFILVPKFLSVAGSNLLYPTSLFIWFILKIFCVYKLKITLKKILNSFFYNFFISTYCIYTRNKKSSKEAQTSLLIRKY